MSVKDVYEKYKFDPSIAKKSTSWFQQQALLLSKERINIEQFHRSHGERRSQILPGNMYMFFYDPKHKETLPHYDRFPLVFPFDTTPDGFIGLNMHYLPYRLRIVLFDALLNFKTNKGFDDKTKLRYSWNAIRNFSRHQLAEKCVKRYILSHVQSTVKLIHPTDWTTTLMLPVESFVGAKKQQVWSM